MSDTVVVMDNGVIQQIGTPEDIYNEPANAFVADFIGESNILDGIMHADKLVEFAGHTLECVDGGFAKDEPVDVVIRPEDVDMVDVNSVPIRGRVDTLSLIHIGSARAAHRSERMRCTPAYSSLAKHILCRDRRSAPCRSGHSPQQWRYDARD